MAKLKTDYLLFNYKFMFKNVLSVILHRWPKIMNMTLMGHPERSYTYLYKLQGFWRNHIIWFKWSNTIFQNGFCVSCSLSVLLKNKKQISRIKIRYFSSAHTRIKDNMIKSLMILLRNNCFSIFRSASRRYGHYW